MFSVTTENDLLTQLIDALRTPDLQPLRTLSEIGALAQLIPEWKRLTGDHNIQHSTHHFPLDDHTLRVVESTKASPYYLSLSPYQQFLTAISALIHDISKVTGPERMRGRMPVDKLHPIKSAEMSRVILGRLGFSPATIQRIYTIIHHHQAFGRLFAFDQGDKVPSILRRIALKVRSQGVVNCLLALSEGDIRSVQDEDAFFTPNVETDLATYAQQVLQEITRFRDGVPAMPQTMMVSEDNLRQGAGCYVSFPDQTRYEAWCHQANWGGAVQAQYTPNITDEILQSAPVIALVRFLPENIAYWGPIFQKEPTTEPSLLSMDMFYALLQPDYTLSSQGLTDVETALFSECQAQRPALQDFLNQWAFSQQHNGQTSWMDWCMQHEDARFEDAETVYQDPALIILQNAYQKRFGDQPCGLIATRPILITVIKNNN